MILRQCIRENRPYPKAIADAPDLEPESELYWFAWIDTGSCRYYEGGEIPWTALRAYADEYEMDEDQRVILYQVIRAVDMWFLTEVGKKADKNGGNTEGRHGSRKPKVLPIGKRN